MPMIHHGSMDTHGIISRLGGILIAFLYGSRLTKLEIATTSFQDDIGDLYGVTSHSSYRKNK